MHYFPLLSMPHFPKLIYSDLSFKMIMANLTCSTSSILFKITIYEQEEQYIFSLHNITY